MIDTDDEPNALMLDMFEVMKKHNPDYKTALFSLTAFLFLHIKENTDDEGLQMASLRFLSDEITKLALLFTAEEMPLQ